MRMATGEKRGNVYRIALETKREMQTKWRRTNWKNVWIESKKKILSDRNMTIKKRHYGKKITDKDTYRNTYSKIEQNVKDIVWINRNEQYDLTLPACFPSYAFLIYSAFYFLTLSSIGGSLRGGKTRFVIFFFHRGIRNKKGLQGQEFLGKGCLKIFWVKGKKKNKGGRGVKRMG